MALPENNFVLSEWENAKEAAREFDALCESVARGKLPWMLVTLFAPTGALQDLSIANDWGEAFLDLAKRFDDATALEGECARLSPPVSAADFESRQVGVDECDGRFADVALLRCVHCGQSFVHYAFSIEGFSHSGRWYHAPIGTRDAAVLTVQTAISTHAKAPWHYCGGSYFESTGTKIEGPVDLERL